MTVRYSPWEHLRTLPHITLGVTRLPAGKGWWMPDLQAIAIDSRLGRVERRTVLAHELVHAERQDENCHGVGPDGSRLARRQEAHADRVASERLITTEDLLDALRAHPYDPENVAEQLDVTRDVLVARLQAMTPEEKDHVTEVLVDEGVIHAL